MKRKKNMQLIQTALLVVVLLTMGVPAAHAQEAVVTVTTPTPQLPVGIITDRTPTFRWTPVPNATHYQLQVVKGTAIVYTNTYTYACVTVTCARTPGTTLALAPYKFRVRAKVGGVWKTWSVYKNFIVVPATLTPKLPVGTTTDSTPTFRWTPVPKATYYQLQVVKGTAIVYTKTYAYACVTATCARTPGTTLALAPYKFRVRAKVGGVWKPWSAYKYFKVIPASFNNNFNTTHPNWKPVTGSWAHLSGLYYASVGVAGKWASIQQINDYQNGTFETQLKRNGCIGCANSIIIRGTPTPLDGIEYNWAKKYEFSYTNAGYFFIYEVNGANVVKLKDFTASSAINKTTTALGKWNTLKVVFAGTTMKFYINGSLVAIVTDASFKKGNLGIQFYRDPTSTGDRLFVNYAKLNGGLADINPMEEILEGITVPGDDHTRSPEYLPNIQ